MLPPDQWTGFRVHHMKEIGFKVFSEQDCKEPREVEKMRKSTSDKKLAADFEKLERGMPRTCFSYC